MLFVCLLLGVCLTGISNASEEKRILLSDPQYIQQELTRFQSELQEMQVKYNTLNTEFVELRVKHEAQTANFTNQNTKLVELQDKITILENALSSQGSTGAVFTRWGRHDCPANITTKVYSGYAGGSFYTHTGGAAEYVCMPEDPTWGPFKDLGYNDHVGYIYGAEYKDPWTVFGIHNPAEDVPCAVCLGKQHTAFLMIPGRLQCYPGWTEIYHGNLASGLPSHEAASQYVCVDAHPQMVPGGGTHDENGKLFYGVIAKCGSLPCPPYEEGKYISCVVCMK